MKSKSEAVEYFSFVSKLMDRYPPPVIRLPDGESCDMNGVFFYRNHAYVSNNVFIGRVRVEDDFPLNESIAFYSFSDDLHYFDPDVLKKAKGAKHGPLSAKDFSYLDTICNGWRENQFFVKRSFLLECMQDISLKTMPTCLATFEMTDDSVLFSINDRRGKLNLNYVLPKHLYPGARNVETVAGDTVSINLFYLFEIVVSAFSHCDIIGFKFDSPSGLPVVLFNNGHSHPNISWAIAQTTKSGR